MRSPSCLSWNLPWAQMRSLDPCGSPVPCLPLTTSERNIPYDCSVSGELLRALLVRAGREGEKPQGVGIQGNNLTCATIAFIARGWRLHSFTSQVYQLQDGWWLLNLWEFSCFSEPWVLGIRGLLSVRCPVASSERLPSKLVEACLSVERWIGALGCHRRWGCGLRYFPLVSHQRRSLTILLSQVATPCQTCNLFPGWSPGDWNWGWD